MSHAQPIPEFNDEVLGHFRYETDLDWYEGKAHLNGAVIFLHVVTGEEEIFLALARVRRIVAQLEKYADDAKEYAVLRLLELKNDAWLDEDEQAENGEPLTAEQFKARMTLQSLIFCGDDVTFFHDDGDLFSGHSIEISLNAKDEFYHADIPG